MWEAIVRFVRGLFISLLLVWSGVAGAYIALARGWLPQYGVVSVTEYSELEQQMEACRLKVKVPLK